MRSPLARLVPNPIDVAAEKERGWRELGILVVNVEDATLDWAERALLRQIAERLYGPRDAAGDATGDASAGDASAGERQDDGRP